MAVKNNPLVSIIDKKLDVSKFREQHWEGTFWEYLDIAAENPSVARNSFQRVYDMILSYGTEAFSQFKQELTRYKFFSDPIDHGGDAIFGTVNKGNTKIISGDFLNSQLTQESYAFCTGGGTIQKQYTGFTSGADVEGVAMSPGQTN